MVEVDLTTRKLKDEKNLISGIKGEKNLPGKLGNKNLVESLQGLGLQVQKKPALYDLPF